MAGAGHVEVLLVFGAKHGAVDAPVDDVGVGVLGDDEVVVGVRVAVAIVMEEERKAGDVDIVALENDLLAGRGRDDLGLDAASGELSDAGPGLVALAAKCPGILLVGGVGIGEKRELAAGDFFDQHRLLGILLHDEGELIDAFYVLDANEKAGFFHCVGEVDQALLPARVA